MERPVPSAVDVAGPQSAYMYVATQAPRVCVMRQRQRDKVWTSISHLLFRLFSLTYLLKFDLYTISPTTRSAIDASKTSSALRAATRPQAPAYKNSPLSLLRLTSNVSGCHAFS